MRDNWQLFKGELTKAFCEKLIENCKNLPEADGATFNGNQNHRRSKVRWLYGEKGLQDILLHYVNIANAEAFNVNIQQEMYEMQFGEYDAEYGGKYDWHHDVNWENSKNFDRKLSIVVQLSDPETYEGGDFEFSEVESPKKEDWGKQGSILVFPSYLTHRVTEVTSGVRYSLVSWVRGARWR